MTLNRNNHDSELCGSETRVCLISGFCLPDWLWLEKAPSMKAVAFEASRGPKVWCIWQCWCAAAALLVLLLLVLYCCCCCVEHWASALCVDVCALYKPACVVLSVAAKGPFCDLNNTSRTSTVTSHTDAGCLQRAVLGAGG
jgi:hypothetical protein